ncbi:hypothetical protein N9K24_03480 [Amylibacter sp.]|nr:hypothetical protein [Amylibacter sp.]
MGGYRKSWRDHGLGGLIDRYRYAEACRLGVYEIIGERYGKNRCTLHEKNKGWTYDVDAEGVGTSTLTGEAAFMAALLDWVKVNNKDGTVVGLSGCALQAYIINIITDNMVTKDEQNRYAKSTRICADSEACTPVENARVASGMRWKNYLAVYVANSFNDINSKKVNKEQTAAEEPDVESETAVIAAIVIDEPEEDSGGDASQNVNYGIDNAEAYIKIDLKPIIKKMDYDESVLTILDDFSENFVTIEKLIDQTKMKTINSQGITRTMYCKPKCTLGSPMLQSNSTGINMGIPLVVYDGISEALIEAFGGENPFKKSQIIKLGISSYEEIAKTINDPNINKAMAMPAEQLKQIKSQQRKTQAGSKDNSGGSTAAGGVAADGAAEGHHEEDHHHHEEEDPGVAPDDPGDRYAS